MIRKVSLILLILVYTLMNFRILTVYAGFNFNKNYIANSLCKNKDVPGSCCKGKCYLNKEVQKADDESSSQSNNNTVNSKEDLSSQIIFSNDEIFPPSANRLYNTYKLNYSTLFMESDTPPPKDISC